MIRVLTTGTLYADPQSRTSQSGKPYATAKLKADGKDGTAVWVSLVAFAELAERLATLKAGAAIAVSGRAELSAYTCNEARTDAEKFTEADCLERAA